MYLWMNAIEMTRKAVTEYKTLETDDFFEMLNIHRQRKEFHHTLFLTQYLSESLIFLFSQTLSPQTILCLKSRYPTFQVITQSSYGMFLCMDCRNHIRKFDISIFSNTIISLALLTSLKFS